jgi:hypothetical protein
VFTAPRLLTAPESLLLAASGAVFGALLAARFGRWSSARARTVGALAAAFIASSLAVAPVTAWAMISDIRASQRLSAREAERVGPESYGIDTSAVDRVAALIPRSSTYSLVSSGRLDANRALVFRLWSLSALLPRVAVEDPRTSDWVVSWGVAPRDLGVTVGDVHELELGEGDPPLWVAKVVR